MRSQITPPLTTESPTTHYCTVQHHVPIDPYAERMPRADCSSNTIRDSISRVAPSLRGPRFAPALRHARRPCALPPPLLTDRQVFEVAIRVHHSADRSPKP